MHIIYFLLMMLAVFGLIIADAAKKINLIHPFLLVLWLAAASNLILGIYFVYPLLGLLRLIPTLFFLSYLWLRLNIFPVLDQHKTSLRLKAMIGGRFLTRAGLFFMIPQILFLVLAYPRLSAAGIPAAVLISNAVLSAVLLFLLTANGVLRMFFTSRRLSILYRVMILMTMWIPVINIFVLLRACRLVYEEYDFACYKENLHLTRVDSDICRTRYPVVMVHGIFFRDLKFFNYWGRIPKELIRYGARIYYGNQEAVGTIETNAEDIRKKILEVVKETGSPKVNIIAHSKGGLDARYAVSCLGMDAYTASVTTMNTPHRGCRFVDKACGLPEGLYRFVAKIFDRTFRKFGDQNPDFYTATRQFSTTESDRFNDSVPDSPNVYYQSYMSVMSSALSDPMLGLPYLMIKSLEGPNDGLVSINSAKWGEFCGVLTSKKRRGISHGDIIDLQRADYKGFDVAEAYIKIAANLKNKGF